MQTVEEILDLFCKVEVPLNWDDFAVLVGVDQYIRVCANKLITTVEKFKDDIQKRKQKGWTTREIVGVINERAFRNGVFL